MIQSWCVEEYERWFIKHILLLTYRRQKCSDNITGCAPHFYNQTVLLRMSTFCSDPVTSNDSKIEIRIVFYFSLVNLVQRMEEN
jgi:hypothetical protein